jgi:2-polyprenyl-3-methyl-5-hydroxy-6-metoxy-1,4-benzoquinol methylase
MSHLDFYQQHGITPVSYDLSSLHAHFERRASLYRSLRLPSLAIRNAHVLEVAAGTGQNSLYLAAQRPAQLTLVEPNPAGYQAIQSLYQSQSIEHTTPVLTREKLEVFAPRDQFDIVICENWLGSSTHERALLRKLASFLLPGGVLAITTVSPIGFAPNVIRRALSACLSHPAETLAHRTQVLSRAFGPHLSTMPAMTRSVEDWVQDNMINPVYFDLCLTPEAAIRELQDDCEVLGSSPDFCTDWRWFKALHGEHRRFNERLLDEYFENAYSFLDHRVLATRSEREAAQRTESACLQLIENVRELESTLTTDAASGATAGRTRDIRHTIGRIVQSLPAQCSRAAAALEQSAALLEQRDLNAEAVAAATEFGGLFGRETVYLSFQKRIDV